MKYKTLVLAKCHFNSHPPFLFLLGKETHRSNDRVPITLLHEVLDGTGASGVETVPADKVGGKVMLFRSEGSPIGAGCGSSASFGDRHGCMLYVSVSVFLLSHSRRRAADGINGANLGRIEGLEGKREEE